MRLGFLTPSSNTVLEPGIAELLRDTPGVSAHFARFRVVAINLGAASAGQFDPAPVLAAAELLADAEVDSICWAGTSGSWLGLAQDKALCAAITARTGLAATTATLALRDALHLAALTRIALVTPYLADVQAAIVTNFMGEGLAVTAERHLDDPGNFSFCLHSGHAVAALIESAVTEADCDAVAIHCTNFRGLDAARDAEQRHGVLALDSIAVSLWGGARAAGGHVIQRPERLFTLG